MGRTAGQRRPGRAEASLLLHCPSRGLDVLARADDASTDAFHVASVGKLFTAVLVGRLIDKGTVSLETKVGDALESGVLDRLFVIAGVDHQNEVTVRHLLGHTSGAADYFEDPCRDGKNMLHLILAEPERKWTPQSLLEFAREQQSAVGTPGERYHYSDTGYIILGLLVEKLEGRPFHEVLHREIFEPLKMERSWMPYRSSPAVGGEEFRPAYLEGTDVSRFPSITGDWTGGGVASTERDLLRFSLALWNGELVSRQLLSEMTQPVGRFSLGMH
jgi:D-alanyl-D-alanine carboxypeptidase